VPDWSAFAGVTGVVLTALLVLAQLSRNVVGGDAPAPSPEDTPVPADRPESGSPTSGDRTGTGDTSPAVGHEGTPPRLSAGALLANVALSQGAFGLLLLAGAWYARVPAAAFGAEPAALTPAALGAGVALGVALYLANEAGATLGERVGLGGATELRAALAPETPRGWAVLLFLVLPVIAGFEELLFRGALVGAIHAGFGVSPWVMAALSSVAFAAGHGAQGPAGIAVTGLLGFVLAAAFIVTGSLLAVVVAHYLVNALEFLVHEGLEIELVD
jgi:membrane protease YdiL (CAAX protease family)